MSSGDTEFSAKLTILITTSPIPSHPSTECLDAVLASIVTHAPGVLEQCDLILSADYYRLPATEDSEPERPQFKKGKINQDRETAYNEYLEAAEKNLLQTSNPPINSEYTYTHAYGHPPLNVYPYTLSRAVVPTPSCSNRTRTLIRHHTHAGFAFSLRCGLLHVATPYVLIVQHDWAFCRGPIPFAAIIAQMEARDDMQFVTFVSARSSGDYVSQANGMHTSFRTIGNQNRFYSPEMDASFDPLFHFLDRMHICRTDLYRNFVFRHPVLRRGTFVEDTFGQWYVSEIKTGGVEAWRRGGTWTFAPKDGMPRIRHLQGRTTRKL